MTSIFNLRSDGFEILDQVDAALVGQRDVHQGEIRLSSTAMSSACAAFSASHATTVGFAVDKMQGRRGSLDDHRRSSRGWGCVWISAAFISEV